MKGSFPFFVKDFTPLLDSIMKLAIYHITLFLQTFGFAKYKIDHFAIY